MKQFLTLLALLLSLYAGAANYSGTLPVLHINTENNAPITSKEDYLNATLWLDPCDTDVEAVGSPENPATLKIRGRGNYSWTGFEKKPYRLKFDSKVSLAGLDSSKHFVLLAHADDSSGFMRNALGFEVSRLLGLTWTPEDVPVEVVLNGDYIGLYFLTENIRVDKKRVNITEQTDNNTDEETLTGGWLIEKDNYSDDPHVTVTEQGRNIWFTYHSPELLSDPQERYLKSQLENIIAAIYNPDKQSTDWEEYLDLDDAARFYIVQEIMDNYEAYHGSCYLYKEIDTATEKSKWHFGPVWDFGSALIRPKKLSTIYEQGEYFSIWISELMKFPRFKNRVRELWQEFIDNDIDKLMNKAERFCETIADAAIADAERWKGKYDYNRDIYAKLTETKRRLRNYIGTFNDYIVGILPPDFGTTRFKVWFDATNSPEWNDVYAYTWSYENGRAIEYSGSWPGTRMSIATSDERRLYTIDILTDADATMPQIIFGNGSSGVPHNQTEDLLLIDKGIYDRNGFREVSKVPMTADNSGLKIYTSSGNLIIYATIPEAVSIFSIDGTARHILLHHGENVITNLPRGIYILKGQKIVI